MIAVVRAMINVLAACVLAWLAPISVSAATAAPTVVYTYDTPSYDAPENYTAPERGPPGNAHAHPIYDAADLRSHAALARSAGPEFQASYDYDGTVTLVQSDIVAEATDPPARGYIGELSAFERWQVAANTGSKFGSLTHAADGIAPYSTQRLITAGQGGAIQAHHLIEKRFADVMGQSVRDMPSIVVTRAEHQVFTNAWRAEIPYGSRNVMPSQVNDAARRIYADYPEILRGLGLG